MLDRHYISANNSIFVYFSAIQTEDYRTLGEGQKVELDVTEGSHRKPQASNVRVVR